MFTETEADALARLRREGLGTRAIARRLGVTRWQVRKWVAEHERRDRSEFFSGLRKFDLPLPPEEGPAILMFDLELSPALGWTYRAWDANIIAWEKQQQIMSVAYKWLLLPNGNDATPGWIGAIQDPNFVPDGYNEHYVVERLHALFEAADIVIAHNLARFDRKHSQSAFLRCGLGPVSPYQEIDTLKVSRRELFELRYSLDHLTKVWGIASKGEAVGIDTWLAALRGDPEAWERIRVYNIDDVIALQDMYLTLRPWMGIPGKPGHPNLGHYFDRPVCSKCGSEDFTDRGEHRTTVSEFVSIRCNNCGGYSRARYRNPQDDGGVAFL